MLMIFALAVGAYGGVRWRAERIAWDNYRIEMARFERAYPEEKPAHQVTISKPFYMGKYEVTQAQYQQVVGKLKESFRGANFPAGNLSWYECLDFCRLNSQTLMRLPTEAEWEFACRAGTDTDFGPGNSAKDLESVAWCSANSGGTSHAVGTKDPNTFGLCDMHGNQFEWTGDCYSDYALGAVTDPSSSPAAPRSVPMALRGGSVIDGPDCCRATTRLGKVNSTRHPLFGFRVVTPIETSQK
jgi:formylglycine-generating enzyme required for sulfatase activity